MTQPSVRVAVLGASNLDLLARQLDRALIGVGLSAATYTGPFDQYRQEILRDDSALHAFHPTHLVVALEFEDLFRDLSRKPIDHGAESRARAVAHEATDIRNLIDHFQRRSPETAVLLQTVMPPSLNPLHFLEFNSPYSIRDVASSFNASLRKLTGDHVGRYLIDYESLVARHGSDNWYDERMWYVARSRLSRPGLQKLAAEYAVAIRASTVASRKCIVLDLDGTLWGGLVGEDGMNVVLGTDGPGLAYRDFQEELLNLRQRGIVLAISSKNDQADAMEVIDHHPHMLLRREHFGVIRVNWEDKATNIRAIADELAIGVDSIVFVDNEPIECEWVRSQLPEVEAVLLPEDPAFFRRRLLELDAFAVLSLTTEDRERAERYQQRSITDKLRASVTSLDEFYEGLAMRLTIAQPGPSSIARVSQLTMKTNQFNLTTRRYTPAQIENLVASAEHRVYSLALSDRFGDQGIVGVAVLVRRGADWAIDTLLLSCRVMGRAVETAFLWFLASSARSLGASHLIGEFIPTSKNGPAEDVYGSHGFERTDDVGRSWRLDVTQNELACPAYFEVHTDADAGTELA